MKNTRKRLVSLYSGIGVMDLGFKDNGWDIVYAIDADPTMCDVYRNNVSENVVNAFIEDIEVNDIPDCDFMIGEIPCFSANTTTIKSRLSKEKSSETNHLTERFIDAINANKTIKGFMMLSLANPRLDIGEITDFFNSNISPDFKVSVKELQQTDLGGTLKRKSHVIIGVKESLLDLDDYNDFIQSVSNRTIKDSLSKVDYSNIDMSSISVLKDETIDKHPDFFSRLSLDGFSQHMHPMALELMSKVSKGNFPKHISENNTNREISTQNTKEDNKITYSPKVFIHPTENRPLIFEEVASIKGLTKKDIGFDFDFSNNHPNPEKFLRRAISNSTSYNFSNNVAKIITDFYSKNFK